MFNIKIDTIYYIVYDFVNRLHKGITLKKIVVDSTVLFLLAKCGILESFCSRFKIIAPRFVINETASLDLAKKYTDASLIHDLVTRGLLNVEQPDTMKLKIPITLHPGERDALILALKSKNCLFATDDGKAIKAARFLKIPFIITPRLLLICIFWMKSTSTVPDRL
jgi:predicted nucleic acid-binding protein